MSRAAHEIDSPSPWVCRWAGLIRHGGRVLDLACGHGRHARYLSALGFAVVAVDRDHAALATLDRDTLEPYWIEINRLENEGDRLYRRAVADLFSGEHRAMDVLKWKEVIENLEEALDGLENVANIIESTVLKHT